MRPRRWNLHEALDDQRLNARLLEQVALHPTQIPVQQMLEPATGKTVAKFYSQPLAHLSLQAFGIRWKMALFTAGALGLNELWRVGGVKGVEFFFAGRNRR